MEKEIKIKTPDKHLIYGTLLSSRKKTNRLVIFCHGFTGNRNEHLHFNGAKYFLQKGFDTFRFDFYTDAKNARHFEDTSLSQHGIDITTVLNYFKNKYEKIYLVGHSFGGTSILFSNTSLIKATVFWDAPFVRKEQEKKDFPFDKNINAYSVNWGMRIIVGKKFVDELTNFPNSAKLIGSVHTPIKFIGAGKAGYKDSVSYFKYANTSKDYVKIAGADHCFNTQLHEQKLFEETLKWIKRY